LKKFLILIIISINLISCTTSKKNQKADNKLNNDILIQWNKYLKNIEKVISSTDDKKTLLKIKTNMISLYIEGRDEYDDFPDDVLINVSRMSEKIDSKIHKKILKRERDFKSIDIVAVKIEHNNFFGAVDDGSNTIFTEKDLNSSYYWPLKKVYITSSYGFRGDPFERDKIKFHHGVDMAGNLGDYITSSNYGKVIFTGENGGYGLMIIISHSKNILTVYGHLSEIMVKNGIYVKRGDVIGKVGSTGRSTGPHLHFEVRKNNRSVDPIFFIESQGIK